MKWAASTAAPKFRELLDGLNDGFARHLGRHLGAPIGIAAQHRLAGPQLLVDAGAARNAAGLHRLDSLPQQLARLDDGLVRWSEVLLAAIDDAAHSLLYGAVLHVDAVDTGEAFGALDLAVDQIVVRAVGLGAERHLVDMQWSVPEIALEPVFLIQRLVGDAVGPVEHHRHLVVDRYPGVAGVHRVTPFRLRRADLVEWQDELIGADVHLAVAERSDAGVLIAIFRDVHDQLRRLASNERVRGLETATGRILGDQPVHDRSVRGVEAAFQTLQPVAFLDHLGNVAMRLRHLRPREFRGRRLLVGRPHISPYDA